MRHEAEIRAILKQVELWPVEERRWLAGALVERPAAPTPQATVTAGEASRAAPGRDDDYADEDFDGPVLPVPPELAMRPDGTYPPQKPVAERGSFSDMIGIANPSGRHYTEEEVDEVITRARLGKYGR